MTFLGCWALQAKTGSSHEFLEAEIHGTETNVFHLNISEAGFCISYTIQLVSSLCNPFSSVISSIK